MKKKKKKQNYRFIFYLIFFFSTFFLWFYSTLTGGSSKDINDFTEWQIVNGKPQDKAQILNIETSLRKTPAVGFISMPLKENES